MLLLEITLGFPGWTVENPNTQKHQKGYALSKEKTGDGMRYFTEEVLPCCAGGVFLAFRDGKFGAGVAAEANFFIEKGLPVWEISPNGGIFPLQIPIEKRVLSVKETLTYIRDEAGNTILY